jgi:hypothetical protein
MSCYYQKQGVSSCEIAGAVAVAAVHDLRVNLFTFAGFPQITVLEKPDTDFAIHLSWTNTNGKLSEVTFQLPRDKAFSAAKRFKKELTHDPVIFEVVQKALAELEGKNAVAKQLDAQ